MTVSISEELESFVTREVANGRYSSPEEAVNTSLKKLRDEEFTRRLTPEELETKLEKSYEEIQRRQYSPASEVFARLRAKNR